jgi:hypothetical protein
MAFVGQSCAAAVLAPSAVRTRAAAKPRVSLAVIFPTRMAADVRTPVARLRVMIPPASFF